MGRLDELLAKASPAIVPGRLADLKDKALASRLELGKRVTKTDIAEGGPVRSSEFRRIAALPAREPAVEDAELTSLVNRWLARTWPLPEGTSLRPHQARAIAECVEAGGGLCVLGVGAGKTLTSILLATAFQKEFGIARPVILVPSKLVGAFKRAIIAARQHWTVLDGLEYRILGYGQLQTAKNADLLFRMAPGLIIADETHNLANRSSARSRRFDRVFKDFPGIKFVGLSGTIIKKSPLDFWHLTKRALGEQAAPVPRDWTEMTHWAWAIEELPEGEAERPAGCLTELGDPGDSARVAFGKRVRRTPGIISLRDSGCTASLSCAVLSPALPKILHDAIESVQTAWEIPDGHVIADATGMHRAVSQLALGFYSKLVFNDADFKSAWYAARRAWVQFCRDAYRKYSMRLDSELAVANAVDAQRLLDDSGVLAKWRECKADAGKQPQNETVWLDTDWAPTIAKRWLAKSTMPGLIWSHWVPAGEHIAKTLEITWYGAGQDPETDAPFNAAVLSVQANKEGRNLQFANRNLFLTVTPSAADWQQMIGRTHRSGQAADEVHCDFYAPHALLVDKVERARVEARFLATQTGEEQKLSLADWEE